MKKGMELDILNQLGEKTGKKIKLNPEIFDINGKEEVVTEVIRMQLSNKRKPIAHTKGRSEVRGGGRKPWRQKGTGRARHGSIRSPLWRGGGVTFGPTKYKNFSKKINKKVRKLALRSVLTNKVTEGKLIVLDELVLKKGKTQEAVKILRALKLEKKSLWALDKKDVKVTRAFSNLPDSETIDVRNVNTYDVINADSIVLTKQGIKIIEELLTNKNVELG